MMNPKDLKCDNIRENNIESETPLHLQELFSWKCNTFKLNVGFHGTF